MLRKLTEVDRKLTLNFLNENPALNLFIIGDIYQYGFNSNVQTFWATFNEQNAISGVLLRYKENYIPYFTDENYDVTPFVEILKTEHATMLSGELSRVERILAYFDNYEKRSMYFCELKKVAPLVANTERVQLATPDDAKGILDLLALITEFTGIRQTPSELANDIKSNDTRAYLIKNDDDVVISSAQTTAETPTAAMVVAVATHPDYRKQGLTSQILTKMCEDLTKQNKRPCLFYDNPKAGSLYHKIGFQTIGEWVMVTLK